MRLKPHEVRIVNQIRALPQGRIIVDKAENGQINVEARQRMNAPQKEAAPGRVLRRLQG